MPGCVYTDRRTYESLGSWSARINAVQAGTVIIGPLEVLDSGPTGPMTAAAQSAARDEVTAQVLGRIRATDKVMASLEQPSTSQNASAQVEFNAAVRAVAEQRHALREDLKTMRASTGDQWSNDRSTVSVSFNAYVQAMHRAEASSAGGLRS